MGGFFKIWRRKLGATLLALICIVAIIQARGGNPDIRSLKFHLDMTDNALEFGIDRTQTLGSYTQVGKLLDVSIPYRLIAIGLTILSAWLLISKSSDQKFSYVPDVIDKSRANGSKSGREKAFCLERIKLHLSNIHKIWVYSGHRS